MDCLSYIVWNPDLTAFFGMRWYSLCWLVGLLLAYLIVKRLYKEQGISQELFDPLFVYCFVGILIGSRLGHCLFYQPDYFLSSWQHVVEMVLPIRFMADGSVKFTGYEGLASHGGTLGLMIALWLYVRKTKLNIWRVLDNIAIATPTTACLIRLGNLMNSEIIGKVTDVPWAFIFERVDPYPRHPGQLYEALTGLRRAVLHRLGLVPPPPAEGRHGLLLRPLPHVHLHRPLLHRVHQGDTGSLRGQPAARHGPALEPAVHSHRRGLHGRGQVDAPPRGRGRNQR